MSPSPELRITWEWEPAPSVRAPEHRATWARIEIQVGSDHVTLAEDEESGSSRRSIYCPLYPLAEWVAYNWWFLQADARPTRWRGLRLGSIANEFPIPRAELRHHSIRASGDGFLWPELLIVPEGQHTRLAWFRDKDFAAERPLRFLAQGEALLERGSVTRELALLVSAVIRRLAELKVVGTSLEKEWSAIQNADEAEQQYCLAAARLGLDPYAEAPQYEAGILRASEAFSGHLLTDFLDSVDPENIDSAIEWVRSARESPTSTAVHDQRESLHALRVEIQRHSGIEPALPWRQGWRQAHLVRDTIGATDTEKIDLSSYVVGIPGDPVDRGLLAVGVGSDNVDPKIVVDRHRARGRAGRFTLGRALWHRVWESEPVFLVTTAYTDRQKVERAFSAELLAPAAGIARLLDHGPELASPEDLEQVADHFDVSSMVVQHQLQNQLLTTRPG